MILNITCKHDPEYIQSILEDDINMAYFKVTHLQSKEDIIHEFYIEDKMKAERLIDLLTLMEIAEDLNIYPMDIRIIVTPNEYSNE